MKRTYLFYDIETTGLNPCFDQVLEFAAIRTDLSLNELERHHLRIKLNNDVVPSPEALITHGIGFHHCQEGISELTAITQIHQWLNQPGTISCGYNTLGFDDEFLRFSFYRNLLTPYTHQYAHTCSRMDLYPMAVMYYLFKPQVLTEWPKINEATSLKLEHLSNANQLSQGPAHSAMVDVEATLALARKFIREKEMWDYVAGFFDKNTDLSRIAQLTKQALMIDGKLGPKNNYMAPVLLLGQHRHYRNQTILLRLDLEITENSFCVKKKIGENILLLPMKPRFLEKLLPEKLQQYQQNVQWLADHAEQLAVIQQHHLNYTYPVIPDIDPDAALYQLGFTTDDQERLFQQFHRAPVGKKMEIANSFSNNVRRSQALRIMGRHFYQHLDSDLQTEYQQYLQTLSNDHNPPKDFRGDPKLTIPKALSIAENLLSTAQLTEQKKTLLTEFINSYQENISYDTIFN